MSQANAPTTKLSNFTDILNSNTAPSFVVGDIVTTDVAGGSNDIGNSVIVQADGKILLGGTIVIPGMSMGGDGNFALVRYNSDGSLDLSFDGDGIVTTDLGGYDIGNSVTVQADGKILLGGSSGGYPNYDFALVRYNPDGSLDKSFDGDGIVTTAGGSGSSVTVQADGKILLGGGNGADMALVRYNSDGSLDGIVTTDLGGNDLGSSVTVQDDGKILLGGSSSNGFALVRYNTDGSPDLSFDGDGKVTTNIGGYNHGSSVIVQADGKILLGGTRSIGMDSDFALVRYNTDGSPDLSFDSDGIVTTDFAGYDFQGFSVTAQADGKILLGGVSFPDINMEDLMDGFGPRARGDFVLIRYNTDGSPDLSFGIVTTDLAGHDYQGFSVTVQADGKILQGGSGGNDFALVRYNPDGSLDNSFNPINTLNSKPSYTETGKAVVLDNTVRIYDNELAVQDNYNGASITLVRQGGANAEDVFSGHGQLSFSGSNAFLSGISIGTVSNSNGTLSINFNSDATQARVDAVLSSIAYRNTTTLPPVPTDTYTPPSVSVQIDWTFNDGNTGAQGIGGALTTTGSSIINILANPHEIKGTTGDDYLRGKPWAKIYGFAGNDSLDGWGADSLLGGLGDDLYSVYYPYWGSNAVIENPNEGADTINSNSGFYHLPDNVENLTLTGANAIYGKGNDLANTLIGNDQDNRLTGGAGADTLTGGLGADIFKFTTETESGITATTRDSIIDFSHDQGDKINLAAIDANTALKGNNTFATLTIGGAFSGTFANPRQLYFDQSSHILYGNNDADSTADFSIKVIGVNSLVATDFVL